MLLTLNNGVKMPLVGMGTFLSKDGDEAYYAVLNALKSGYRLIDTAAAYKNEVSVGRAIKDSGVPREEIFVTTKLWNGDQGYETTKEAIETSLSNLGLDYIDLFLIHWPKTYDLARESYRAMEEYYHNKKIRALGVSNFNIHHLDNLLKYAKVKPTMNQVELHPRLQQHNLQKYCLDLGIHLTSYSPLMKGDAFKIDDLIQLAEKYNKSIVNIIVRWGIQRNIVMIPKSANKERIIDNLKVFDFELTDDDMAIIRKLNSGKKYFPDPDNIDW